jgi:hypothetical protein
MVDAIKKAGSTSIRLTTLAQVGHLSWQSAYASPDMWQLYRFSVNVTFSDGG